MTLFIAATVWSRAAISGGGTQDKWFRSIALAHVVDDHETGIDPDVYADSNSRDVFELLVELRKRLNQSQASSNRSWGVIFSSFRVAKVDCELRITIVREIAL